MIARASRQFRSLRSSVGGLTGQGIVTKGSCGIGCCGSAPSHESTKATRRRSVKRGDVIAEGLGFGMVREA